MLVAVLLLVTGFVILVKGADFLVSGASSIAKNFGISNLAIGLTVVAFGTSMPELIVSLVASLNGQNDASFGNVIGSNNFNLLFILGVAGIIYPLVVQRKTIKVEVPISFFAVVLLFFLVNDRMLGFDGVDLLTRMDSLILLLFFAGFMVYIYRTMTHTGDGGEEAEIKLYKKPLAVGMIFLGLAMLIGGGTLVVNNATAIAEHFGLSEKLIGLTILAMGTSLPELATSAVAAFRKNTDIAIGNVVGSNIFNIFFILGIAGLVNPIPYNSELNFDLYVILGGTVALMIFMFTLRQRRLDRWEAALLFIGYVCYTLLLISRDATGEG